MTQLDFEKALFVMWIACSQAIHALCIFYLWMPALTSSSIKGRAHSQLDSHKSHISQFRTMATVTIPQTAIRIKNTQTGRLLYDNPDSGFVSWQESTNSDGYWYITPMADNIYKIKNSESGNCIYYNINLKKPLTWQDSANEDGKWEIVSITDTTFKIRNVLTPSVILFDNPSAGIIGYEDNNATDGIWTILN